MVETITEVQRMSLGGWGIRQKARGEVQAHRRRMTRGLVGEDEGFINLEKNEERLKFVDYSKGMLAVSFDGSRLDSREDRSRVDVAVARVEEVKVWMWRRSFATDELV